MLFGLENQGLLQAVFRYPFRTLDRLTADYSCNWRNMAPLQHLVFKASFVTFVTSFYTYPDIVGEFAVAIFPQHRLTFLQKNGPGFACLQNLSTW